MNQKSAIQIIGEMLMAKEAFGNHLQSINEQYQIKDNIFVCGGNHDAIEPQEGYYGEVATYESLEDALENFNVITQGIRIHEGKFSVGNLYKKLSDVQEELIIDLSNSTIL